MKPRPTQKDVAKLAGVSTATVSQVINNRTDGNIRISEDTRQKVWDAVRHLGYMPNASARSLRTQKSNLIAVMVPDIANPYYPEFIRGVQEICWQHDYDLLVYDANDLPEREKAFVEAIVRRQVDGVVFIAFYLTPEDTQVLTNAHIPIATTMYELKGPGIDVLYPDNPEAVFAAMKHLVDRGHQRIAHIAGTLGTAAGDGRLQGYKDALAKFGVPFDENLVHMGNFRSDSVAPIIDKMFAPDREPPTAIFAANDVMAIEAIQVLMRRGYRIPEDVAIVGYDDIPGARAMLPSLTTISHETQELGREVASLLIRRLQMPDRQPESKPFKFKLMIREST